MSYQYVLQSYTLLLLTVNYYSLFLPPLLHLLKINEATKNGQPY